MYCYCETLCDRDLRSIDVLKKLWPIRDFLLPIIND